MPNAIDQRLASRLAQQKIKLLAQSERAALNMGRVYDALLRDLLALAIGDGVTDALARDAREAAERASVAARETLRQDLVASVQASRKATIATLLDTVPLRWFRAIAPELAVLPLPESLQERAVDDPQFVAAYDYEPIAQRRLTRDQAMALIRELAFPPLSPDAVETYLDGGPGGISWDERLRYWDGQARDQMLSQLVDGVSAGESVVELRKRLEPITDGVRWKAQRVARTEARRVAERSQVDTYAEMGDMIEAMQIIATLDQWTRPEHAARHGKTYRRQPDGGFVADDGEVLPDLPDQANCRCYASPILATPAEFLKNPALAADFQNAQAEVIPDPAAYVQWFDRAPEKERALAVGVRRYRAMERKLAGTGQRPEWPDFIDADGKLLSIQRLAGESAEHFAERKRLVTAMLEKREALYKEATRKGLVPA
jgi:SPP1 gp7 family putative phage head morphogenesis protein